METERHVHTKFIQKNFPFLFDSISASSGNSAELTTLKDLKRSKNKGRKKKAKTKQSQIRLSKPIEPIQEAKPKPQSQDADTFTAPTLKLQNALAADTKKLEEAATKADEAKLTDSKITGLIFFIFKNQPQRFISILCSCKSCKFSIM